MFYLGEDHLVKSGEKAVTDSDSSVSQSNGDVTLQEPVKTDSEKND